MITQLSVFIENRKGHLASAVRVLAQKNIDMLALFVADTQDFGVARIFCDDPQSAAEALREAGFRAQLTSVIAVEVSNCAGGLAQVLDIVNQADVQIEYSYCFAYNDKSAVQVMKISDENAQALLVEKGLKLVEYSDLA